LAEHSLHVSEAQAVLEEQASEGMTAARDDAG